MQRDKAQVGAGARMVGTVPILLRKRLLIPTPSDVLVMRKSRPETVAAGLSFVVAMATFPGSLLSLLRAIRLRYADTLHTRTTRSRIAPATLVAVTQGNQLITFDSATPNLALTAPAITGLEAGDTILGIDFRPATGDLYALSATRLYRLDIATGLATEVATLAADPSDLTNPFAGLSGTSFGVDFNPVADRLRVVSDSG